MVLFLFHRLEKEIIDLQKSKGAYNSKIQMLLANLKQKEAEILELMKANDKLVGASEELHEKKKENASLNAELVTCRKRIAVLEDVSFHNIIET